jgi:hypothetical protein
MERQIEFIDKMILHQQWRRPNKTFHSINMPSSLIIVNGSKVYLFIIGHFVTFLILYTAGRTP